MSGTLVGSMIQSGKRIVVITSPGGVEQIGMIGVKDVGSWSGMRRSGTESVTALVLVRAMTVNAVVEREMRVTATKMGQGEIHMTFGTVMTPMTLGGITEMVRDIGIDEECYVCMHKAIDYHIRSFCISRTLSIRFFANPASATAASASVRPRVSLKGCPEILLRLAVGSYPLSLKNCSLTSAR